jgi:hypothetical protein
VRLRFLALIRSDLNISAAGSHTEAIRELDPLLDKADIALAVCACLLQTHKLSKVKDKDALASLKVKLAAVSKSVSPLPYSTCAARC